MTNLIKNRLFCAALLLSSLQVGFAQSQTNVPTFSFGLPLTPVWDISGSYYITNHLQGATIRPLDIVFRGIDLSVDAHGKVLGTGTTIVLVGDDYVGGDYKISGNMNGGGLKTRANFSIHFKGNGIVAGVSTTCNISANYKLEVNPVGLNMVGTTSGSANFSHLGGGKLKSPISLPLPPGVDGGWNVTLDIAPFKNLAGTATIIVDHNPGTVLTSKLTGNVSKRPPVAKVKLSGTGYSAGTQLNLNFTANIVATNQLASVKGKILGQKVQN